MLQILWNLEHFIAALLWCEWLSIAKRAQANYCTHILNASTIILIKYDCDLHETEQKVT